MEKFRGKHITNFIKKDLFLYKVALIVYDKTEEKGLNIYDKAYDVHDNLLEHMCALHKRYEIGDLSDFWRLFEKLSKLSKEELIVQLRGKKLKRILQ